MSTCSLHGCGKPTRRRGYCSGHYQRLLIHGDPLGGGPERLRLPGQGCSVEGCDGDRHARGLCGKHYWRIRAYGSVEPPKREPKPPTKWVSKSGYVVVYAPDNPMVNSSGNVMEHRLVMSEALGRPLDGDENVHHINGDRADNRIENLELWSKCQPAGQRVEDKVDFAVAILARYRPDLLAQKASAGLPQR